MDNVLLALQVLVGALIAYMVLCVGHAVLSVALRLAHDTIRFLMKVFHVKPTRRR